MNDGVSNKNTLIQQAYPAALLGVAVLTAALLGILTRPTGLLATVWPANAIMLGVMIRYPKTNSQLGWLFACVAYMVADLATGSDLLKALLLNAANLTGVSIALACATFLPSEGRSQSGPRSMLYLLLFATAGAAGAGVMGAIANPVLFGGDALAGWQFWFATELVNYIAFLPVILTFPVIDWSGLLGKTIRLRSVTPALAFVLLCCLAVVVKGEGAIAFPVPGLFWCAIAYTPFATALLTLAFGCWSLFALSAGYIPLHTPASDELGLVSVRLAISLISIAPQMLSATMASRNEALSKLRIMATHDALTGLMNRSGFLAAVRSGLLSDNSAPASVIMFDVDHFKSVNDSLGHLSGDEVLAAIAGRASRIVGAQGLLGRVGGEEFAVVSFNSTAERADELAERLRSCIEAAPVILENGTLVQVTVSVGYAHGLASYSALDSYMAAADAALYQAKGAGRNRVMPVLGRRAGPAEIVRLHR